MVCSGDSRLRRAEAGQGGSVRQQHSAEQSGETVDWECVASTCENTAKEELQGLSFDPADLRKEMIAAGEQLGMKGLHPYQLRHGGAADDLNSKMRDYQGVKNGGRWQTDQSARRYTKVGKIQQILN